jgi:hypothetical protein
MKSYVVSERGGPSVIGFSGFFRFLGGLVFLPHVGRDSGDMELPFETSGGLRFARYTI